MTVALKPLIYFMSSGSGHPVLCPFEVYTVVIRYVCDFPRAHLSKPGALPATTHSYYNVTVFPVLYVTSL